MVERPRLASMPRFMTLLALVVVVTGGCALRQGGGSSPTAVVTGGVRVTGRVVAGPTCPVVTEPPQSGCDERPVPGAVLLVLDSAGEQAARVTSAADGTFAVVLPAGRYRLVPQPVPGLMGTAPEQPFTVGSQPSALTVAYDTGIR